MKIVSRMVFAQIMKSSLFVLLTLVALFAFFDLIGQSGNIGTSYSMGQAFLLTALILPTRCYEVLPIAVMLGSIFTLSRLASTSQFSSEIWLRLRLSVWPRNSNWTSAALPLPAKSWIPAFGFEMFSAMKRASRRKSVL